MKLFNNFLQINKIRLKAATIKADSEKKSHSAHFALTGSLFSIIALGFIGGACFLFTLNGSSASVIVGIIIAVIFFLFAVLSFFGSIIRIITQFAITHNVWSWLSALIFLGAICGSVTTVLIFFS